MKKTLDIAPDLAMPIDYVTGSAGIFATKGMGKSYLAQVLAEEMLDRGQQVVVIDPTDAWYGLRSGVGNHPGYSITVIGGDHADMQLEPESAEMLADAILDERFSCIVCTDRLSATQEIKFVRVLLDRLFRRMRDTILHVFVDEADIFAPTKPFEVEDSRCVRAMANIARRGRRKGLGSTFITQRPAELNPGVRGMCEMLFVLGMDGHLDIEAIERWVRLRRKKAGDNTRADLQQQMIDSLDTLAQGDAWVWAPRRKLHQQFRARVKHTFDSGATPKVGERVRAPKALAPVDIARLGAAMAAALERQQAEDPKALKAKVATLGAELEKLRLAKLTTVPVQKVIEKSILKSTDIARAEKLVEKMLVSQDKLVQTQQAVVAEVGDLRAALKLIAEPKIGVSSELPSALRQEAIRMHHQYRPKIGAPELPNRVVRGPQLVLPKVPLADVDGAAEPLAKMERAVLTAIVQHYQLTRKQVLIFTGYRHSGATTRAFARLIAQGMIESSGGFLRPTEGGRAALGDYEVLPVGADLRARLLNGAGGLTEMEKTILRGAFDAYPSAIDRTAARGVYKHSGATTRAFARLIAMNYVTKQRGGIRAAEELMS